MESSFLSQQRGVPGHRTTTSCTTDRLQLFSKPRNCVMRPVAECLEQVRALERPVRAILVSSESDDCSGWWEINVILERQPPVAPAPLRWVEHEHFESHFVEMSYPTRTIANEAAERAACVELGQALANALSVPFYAVPPDLGRPHIGWLVQSQIPRLVELLENARHLVVLSGRRFSPVQSVGRIHYRELLESAEARARHWAEKVSHWERFQEWKRLHVVSYEHPYLALVELDRRGILEGVIDETPFGHLQVARLGVERIAQIHGSLAEVECLRCDMRTSSEPAIDQFRRTGRVPQCACGGWLKLGVLALGQVPAPQMIAAARRFCERADLILVLGSRLATEPCASIVLKQVRTRRVPLVVIGYDETNGDRDASLVINADCERVFPFAIYHTACGKTGR